MTKVYETTAIWSVALGLILAAGTWSCGEGGDGGEDTGGLEDTGTMADGGDDTGDPGDAESDATDDGGQQPEAFHDSCTAVVGPGADAEASTQNLERAFIEADQDSVICIVDGEYEVKRQLDITKSDVTIRGESQDGTILDFGVQEEGANGILVQAEQNFVARDFTIKNTASDSLKVKSMDGVVFKNVTVTWDAGPSQDNGAYALYPVESENVLIEGCKVSYAADAGVYLGQSENAIIRDNEAFGNVIGIEIENTYDAAAYNNDAHGNSCGFLVINLPDLMVKGGARNHVYDNEIVDNNEPNFGKEGTAVSNMPQGSGLLVVSADRTEAYGNTISGNESLGIGIANYGVIETNIDDPEYDPYPEGNWLHDNTLDNNGENPHGPAQIFLSGGSTLPQMLWDGQFGGDKDNADESLTNCANNNTTSDDEDVELTIASATSQCPDSTMDENGEFCVVNDCTHDSLESVELPERVEDLAK